MMKKLSLMIALLALAGCATPVTTLRNAQTGQTATCGGGTSGSWSGGVLGYYMQKSNDGNCETAFQQAGYTIVETK